jgi:hypothetical protein
MFRKRADRIKGVAGSFEGRAVLIADAVAGPGPGVLNVIARAGATVTAAATDTALLDVAIARIDNPPHPIDTVLVERLSASPSMRIDDLVVNPPRDDDLESCLPWIDLASTVATGMQDRGHAGSIVFVIPIERAGPAGPVAAFLRSEMENLAARVAPNAIRVNAVACGPVGSTRHGQPHGNRATPLGHVTVHPVDVGKAVWFLLNGDLSAAVTGTTLRVDRGATLVRPDW